MKRRVSQAVSLCLIAGFVFPGMPETPVFAAETEAAAETDGETGSETAVETELSDVSEAEAAGETEEADSVVGELIFAQCEDYVNIRAETSTEGEITAKIYNNDSATVISEADGWYEISSGNAHGYVKAEYFATGEEAEAIADEVAYNVARVETESLNIRSGASTDSEVIDVALEGDEIEVVLYGEDWMKVALGNDVYGYIKADYVEYVTYYPVAETLEEEAARLIEEENAVNAETEAPQTEAAIQTEAAAVETEAVQAETAAQTETEAVQAETVAQTETGAAQAETTAQTETEAAQTETSAQTETEATQSSSSSSSSTGASIASYALQFVGNPYVYGGTSLTSGADCSGFVQSVFAYFGISLSRTASAQTSNGTSVSLSEIQAGDLLFYSSNGDGVIDHVAIYTGSGMIVHAANSSRGICTDSAYYSTPICAVRCY
ncbi:MAG: C40 family peptidase [Lachnospiraceae bacterium]|nr:C40 family peptidase [Lachnospiraceae bacterium]